MNNLKLLLLMPIMLFFFSLQSQELSRSVFASSGETSSNGNLKLSWTIGQSGLVGYFAQNSISLNAGFQQNDTFYIVPGMPNNNSPVLLRVFPNPFIDAFYINFQSQNKGQIQYYIYDNMGRLVLQKQSIKFHKDFFEEEVMFSNRPSGIYNLILFYFLENHNPTQLSIKLIKQ